MRSLVKLSLIAAGVSIAGAVPAFAQKASSQKPVKAEGAASDRIPPGILAALERGLRNVGHGSDVPRGKGKGWGHLLHDHGQAPVSP